MNLRFLSMKEKVGKEFKKIRQLADPPANPAFTPPFFPAIAHGVNQIA
jgi:hypothetical protein